ncbi:UDP-N-acetylmuramoyl-L-alanyl-D-glutamate--2,6-diaminopimelate ligase [Stomatohabitans albus]|uniref:UDP-N-acetylmuramoyl-L-alanyl-D-glutamate--2, 6-diaminopimelate ligase n=1 Tax=Stomatohabitans albus TaxID=3110766 RepID=UPI00300C1E29
MPISLPALVNAIAEPHGARLIGNGEPLITDATLDSRQVQPGWLFIARPGAIADGHDFVDAAVTNGASAVVVQREVQVDIPQIIVPNVAQAVGDIAAAVHDYPSAAMQVIGVTGTNGKTTTTWIIHQILSRVGLQAGLIGTVEAKIGQTRIEGIRTTPEATDIQRLLARMRDASIAVVAMEVSSHGIDLGRINGLSFDAVGFTNLTQDHLDYHHTMEAYAQVKASLFDSRWARVGAMVLGDPNHPDNTYSDYVYQHISLPFKTISQYRKADVDISSVQLFADESTCVLEIDGKTYDARVPLPGRFNVDNAALAVTLCHQIGVDVQACVDALATSAPTPGRAEQVRGRADQPTVLVDYAHTPDALSNVLASLRQTTSGNLICVIGCGGDRDREKRPLMAHAALAGADHSVFTSDNPRSENPETILDEMTAGLDISSRWVRVTDRREAIAQAITLAGPHDVVLIAGKGHETYQEINGVKHHFDDREVAQAVLARG